MKKLSLCLIGLLLWYTSYSQDCDCDHIVTPDDFIVDGIERGIHPGERICVQASFRTRIRFQNISGTASEPIEIINCGGPVHIDASGNSYGIRLRNCDFIELNGNGYEAVDKGFEIEGADQYGILINNLSNHFSIRNIDIHNCMNYGIYCKNDPECDLSANKDHFALENIILEFISIHDNARGIRFGHPDYNIGVSKGCGLLFPHFNYNLYFNQIDIANITNGDGIRLYGSAAIVQHCSIYNTSGRGITVGTGSQLTLEHSKIQHTKRQGIRGLGNGHYTFLNNLFYHNGETGYSTIDLELTDPDGDIYDNLIQIHHNSIIVSGEHGINFQGSSHISHAELFNNLLVAHPEAELIGMDSPEILLSSNLELTTIDEAYFKNAPLEDFRLTSSSPAINVGIGSLTENDLLNNPRSLAGMVDAGAYEYVPEPLNYFPSISLKGLYVNDFKFIIGNTAAENELLEYAQINGFNYLLLYNLAYIHTHLFDLTDPVESEALSNFIFKAKTEYGIVQIGAVGEKSESFDKVESYNDLQTDWFSKFDVLNLEFEFWANTSGSVFDYYCDTYLSPDGFSCDNNGAYEFYLQELIEIDERAHSMGIISEIYIGNGNDDQNLELAENCDRMLLHYYRTSDIYSDGRSIYNYKRSRIAAIALSTRQPAVMPIFSARSFHMGPWLLSHSIDQPFDTWLNGIQGYFEDDTPGVSDLKIAGFQWYRYSDLFEIHETSTKTRGGLHIKQSTLDFFNIYPNPCADFTTFLLQPESFDSKDEYSYEIYSSTGQKLSSHSLDFGQNVVAVQDFNSGIYLVRILKNNQQIYHTTFAKD